MSHGWWYGSRSDDTICHRPVTLLDVHWVEYDWKRHLDRAAEYRPWLAVVPDTLSLEEMDRTLRQAEEIAPYCEQVLIVPKAEGVIEQLPRKIGGKPVVLGYSVPTGYGGTGLFLSDFLGWPVHLLGGNPRRQKELCDYLQVVSADGNLAWRLARQGVVVTERGTAGRTIKQLDGRRWPKEDAHLESLRRSLVNLAVFWRKRPVEWYLAEGQ